MRQYNCLDEALQEASHRVTAGSFAVGVETKLMEQLETRLAFWVSTGTTAFWWARPLQLGNVQGGILRSMGGVGLATLDLSLRRDGGIVKEDWWIFQAAGGGTTWFLVETIGPKMTDENSYWE